MSQETFPLSDYACFYLVLSKPRRRIFQYLRWYGSRYPTSFPKVSSIADFARISERAVQKFFEKLRNSETIQNYLKIETRKNNYGGSASNQYTLNKDFKKAMDWLSIYGKLDAPRKHTLRIVSSMKKQEKVHPLPPQKFTPSSVTPPSLNPQTFRAGVWIHPNLKNLKIDYLAKAFASRFASEFEIADTLEACRHQEKKQKLKNPSSYFMGTLKNKMKKRRSV